jgi:streptogramin lyase
MTYGVVAAIGVNSKQHVFVYQRMPVPIMEFDGQGRFVRGLREGTDTRAHGLRIDSDDNIWIVDSGAHTVTKLSPRGDVLMTLGTKGVTGSGADAASRALFNIRVTSPSYRTAISSFPERAGRIRGSCISMERQVPGAGPRVYGGPTVESSFDRSRSQRSDYVADREVRASASSAGRHPVPISDAEPGLWPVIDRNQQLWVSTGADGMVLKVDADGKEAWHRRRGPGQIGEGHLLTVTPTGDIYVADSVNRTA